MKKLLLFFVLVASFQSMACVSEAYSGLRINVQPDKACLINSHDYCVQEIDTSTVDVDVVSAAIKKANLTESILIARVLAMYTDKNLKLRELVNLACTQPKVADILISHMYSRLVEMYKPSQLKKLMKRKK